MSQYQFGSGNLYALLLEGGILVPRKFGALQEVSVDFTANTKELYGQNQFPLAVARGQGKIVGKAKFASLNGGMINDIFFAGTNATGQTLGVVGEPHSIPGTSAFTITVTNSATWVEDWGVTNASTGVAMLRVPSGPTTGQYSVAAGVYTFAAADANTPVLIDYGYTAVTGNTTTIVNQLMGVANTFSVSVPMLYSGKQLYLHLNACVSTQLTFATKIEDFVVPDFAFSGFSDASGNIGKLSLTE